MTRAQVGVGTVTRAIPPVGELLAAELEKRGWTQTRFAEIIDRPVQAVCEIVGGKKEITRQTAAQIAAALGTDPEHWLNRQHRHHLWRQAQDEATRARLDDIRGRAHRREWRPVTG